MSLRTFSAELRARIRAGESPRTAMREAWRTVRAGRAAPPPRRRRRRNPTVSVSTERGGLVRQVPPISHVGLAVSSQVNPRKGERLRPELKEARRLIRIAARTGGTVPFDLRTLVESGVSLATIRKVFDPRQGRPVYPGESNPAGFCPERLEAPSRFDRRSFRTVVQAGHRVTIGCPTGHYDARRRRCRVGTRAQRVLHPAGERGTCPIGGMEANPKGRAIRYSQLSEAERVAIVDAYHRARAMAPRGTKVDPLHAAAIAAREILVRSDREWNTARGTDAFGAVLAVLAFRGAIKVNPFLVRGPRGDRVFRSAARAQRYAARAPKLAGQRRAVYRISRREARRLARENPPVGATKIYDRIVELKAIKGRRSRYPGRAFVHRFRTKAAVYGLPDRSVLIR